MRLLVIGTGVIGTTYAWQLMQAGCEVTHYVRKGRKEMFDREGMKIECLDMRRSKGVETKVDYRPDFVDCLANKNRYDLILISVGSDQLVPVLELLKEKAGEADVLFFRTLGWERKS